MPTPYDNKILLLNWLGANTPGATPADTAALIKTKMPNVAGIMLKTSNGVSWQGLLTSETANPKAITGVNRIEQWVQACEAAGLEVHVWGVPRAKKPTDIPQEIERLASAATVAGVKSLALDVETGPAYWLGTPAQAEELMQGLRARLPAGYHVGLILDGRRSHPIEIRLDRWLPFVDSLQPMFYPVAFGRPKPIDDQLAAIFQNLASYNKPLVPMLQCFSDDQGRPEPAEVTQQAILAFQRGAVGVTYFRLGSDQWNDGLPQMGEREYQAIAAVPLPQRQPPPPYTWQDLFNASEITALRRGGNWQEDWWVQAGAWTVWENSLRNRPYSGPAVAGWPIDPAVRADILQLLQNPGAPLAKLTIEVQTQHKPGVPSPIALVGIHGAPGIAAPPSAMWDTWINLLKAMHVQWYKQCDNGDPNDTRVLEWCKRLQAEGITPIIRYLEPAQFPDPLPEPFFAKMRLYAQAGIRWAEIGNEPNLDIEWKAEWRNTSGSVRMSQAFPDTIRQVAEAWVTDAQKAVQAGVKPAFYAFAPTDWGDRSHPHYSSVFFTQKVVAYLAQHHRAAVLDLFNTQGAWIAVHAAAFEQRFDFDPFNRPSGVVWDMTLRSYEVVLQAFEQHLGLKDLTVISTEGGVFTPDSNSMSGHARLRSNTEHAESTVAMFKWLAAHAPRVKAMCPWCLSVGDLIGHFDEDFKFDGWVEQINGQLSPRPVVEAMRALRLEPLPGFRLQVPYLSQWDETAGTHTADCGPTAVAMVLNAGRPTNQQVSVDQLYQRYLPSKGVPDFSSAQELIDILQKENVPARWQMYATEPEALTALRALLDQGLAPIALVNYAPWAEPTKNTFKGGHFVVVTGYDADHIFVHDPLFRAPRRAEGRHYGWPTALFASGWGGGHALAVPNPDFALIIPQKTVARE